VQENFARVWNRRSVTVPVGSAARPENEKAWWKELVRDVFESEGGVPDFDRFFEELNPLFVAPELWELFPEVTGTLASLQKAGIRLAIVSNWGSDLEKLCRNLGIDRNFDLIVASSVIGISKPDPRIFEHALSCLGIQAHEAVHVGDTLRDDVWGARASNVTPVWLRRPGMAGSEGGMDVVAKPGEPGVSVVTSLAEVVELVIS
jgi:putative hydrolase of the HAD superfamily